MRKHVRKQKKWVENVHDLSFFLAPAGRATSLSTYCPLQGTKASWRWNLGLPDQHALLSHFHEADNIGGPSLGHLTTETSGAIGVHAILSLRAGFPVLFYQFQKS